MEKRLKIIAMLLVVAIVVSAAGCTGKTTTPGNETSGNETSGNETLAISNQTTPAVSATPSPVETSNVTEKANETVTEGGNIENTENITAPEIKNATYVAPHEPSSEANQITYTVYNNSEDNTPVVSNQGTLKITPSGTNTTQGNTTTTGDPFREQKIAQNHTSTNKTISL